MRIQCHLRRGQHRRVPAAVGQGLPFRAADQHDVLQPGTCRPHLVDHGGVVRGHVRPGGHQQAHAGLAEHVLELVGAVGRVDADQNRADLGRGILQLEPLGTVGGPDADPVALPDAAAQQAVGEGVDLGVQGRVGVPAAGGVLDQRVPVAVGSHRAVEVIADRLLEQRAVGGSARVGLDDGAHGHLNSEGCRSVWCRVRSVRGSRRQAATAAADALGSAGRPAPATVGRCQRRRAWRHRGRTAVRGSSRRVRRAPPRWP